MLPRRIALLASVTLMAGAGLSGAAEAQSVDDSCGAASPTAMPCVFAQKAVEATPVGGQVDPVALAAYQDSWLHRTAQFQYRLANPVPFSDAPWLGTHNSFNANANGRTVSHADSNQQLTLTQQLDGDMRSVELDLHFTGGQVRVCHARPASEQHAGCTTEPTFAQVLPEIVEWVAAHDDQTLLLYLEDALGSAGYAPAIAALENALGPRIYKPAAPAGSDACTRLPLDLTRRAVREAGKNVVVVGDCAGGWSSHVFGWKGDTSTESGDSTGYTCSSPIARDKYASTLVRFFEDSTFVATVTAPQEDMKKRREGMLTPDKVAAMTECGVNLFGFDQFDPNDGRVEASIWSWAPGQPSAADGACAIQRPDGRWTSARCAGPRPAACLTATGWTLSRAVAAAAAPEACKTAGGRFEPPRTGEQNAALRSAAGGAEPWLARVKAKKRSARG